MLCSECTGHDRMPLMHSCQLVHLLDLLKLFYTVFQSRTSTIDRLITVTYSPILKKRVSLSFVATSSRHFVYVTVISSYELVNWDYRKALCTILTKNSFFTLDPRWLRQTLHSTQRLCMSNMREKLLKIDNCS